MGTAVCVGPSLWVSSTKRAQEAQGQCRPNWTTALCLPRSSSNFSLSHFRPSFCNLTRRCFLGSQVQLTKQASTGHSWSASRRRRLREGGCTFIVYGVDHLGLEPVVDGEASEENVKALQRNQDSIDIRSSLDSGEYAAASEESITASEGGALELVDTDGIIFEEEANGNYGNDINGMLSQPRNYSNWQSFASEEGARPTAGTRETDTDSSTPDDETGSDSEIDEGSSETLVRRRKAEDVLPVLDSAAIDWTRAEKEKVKSLQAYKHRYESNRGLFVVEAMRPKHMNDTEELLVDSFAELMGGLLTYRPLLALTVKKYVRERYATLPHSVTLVGLYAPVEGVPVSDEESPDEPSQMQQGLWVVTGTVELSFSVAGHPDVPTPAPPPNSPYICNMAISKEYRRRGLGRQMLRAAEELALRMGCEDMYLHVRMIDTAPLTMYREAGYQVVSTDSLLSVLTFQRRRHLMRKRLSQVKLVPE